MLAINIAGNSSANVPIIGSMAFASCQYVPYSLIQYVTKTYHLMCFTVPRAFCHLSIPNANFFASSQGAWKKLNQNISKWQSLLFLVQMSMHCLGQRSSYETRRKGKERNINCKQPVFQEK
jgi:hypothetical protein